MTSVFLCRELPKILSAVATSPVIDQARKDTDLEGKRKRLLFQSTYRGMAEMDYYIGNFATAYLPTMTSKELNEWDVILQTSDRDLYKFLIMRQKKEVPETLQSSSVWKKLLECGPELVNENMDRIKINYKLT